MSESNAFAAWEGALPPALAPCIDALRATERPCVRLVVSDVAPEAGMGSYLACYEQEDEDGRRFVAVLIRIDLGQWPPLPHLPPAGVLTCHLDDAALAEWRFAPLPEDGLLQLDAAEATAKGWRLLAIEGQPDRMPMPPEDVNFPVAVAAAFEALGPGKWQALADYRKAAGAGGHRLGGYAAFLQDDSRQPQEASQSLLLQLDADPAHGLYWGDMGRAHWFVQSSPGLTRSLDAAGASEWQLRFHVEMS